MKLVTPKEAMPFTKSESVASLREVWLIRMLYFRMKLKASSFTICFCYCLMNS